MRFTFSTLIAALVSSSATASAAPVETRRDALKPFEVTAVAYNRPSGLAGSSPWTTIRANVTDPNSYSFTKDGVSTTVPAGIKGVNCLAQWLSYPSEYIEGRTFPCDPVEQGYWAIQVYKGTEDEFSRSSFKLKFIHSIEGNRFVGTFRARVEGEALFQTGANGNTTSGCTSTGSCGANLKPELVPLLVPVTQTL